MRAGALRGGPSRGRAGIDAPQRPCVDSRTWRRPGERIVPFDEEPLGLASPGPVHTDERKLALEFRAIQRHLEMARGNPLRHRLRDGLVCQHVGIGALIPDRHGSGPILPCRNRAREGRVGERMVLDLHGEALVGRIGRGALRDRPALEHAIHLQPEIVMQAAGMVLLHDKERPGLHGLRCTRARLWGRALDARAGVTVCVACHRGISWHSVPRVLGMACVHA